MLERSAENMNLCEKLLHTYGENPYRFFWVLRNDSSNPHLCYKKQNKKWSDTLWNEVWFAPFRNIAALCLISDNGDLVFDLDGRTLLANPRGGGVEVFDETVDSFIGRARSLSSQILPDDL